MSRIIKFRRYEGLNFGKMTYDTDNTSVHSLNWKQWCHPDNVNEFTYMQWTGLVDKNGVDIYEGDIVKIFHGSKHERIDQILWNEYCAGFVKGGAMGASLFGGDQIEVIGNIYQNPELLEVRS